MKYSSLMTALTLVISFTILSIACSNVESPIEPPGVNLSVDLSDLPESVSPVYDNHRLFAVYDAIIDPAAGTFELTPSSREASYHFPLTQLFPNVLQITGFSFTPNFWADIKLTHPYPGSGIKGYDPRVIAILPANNGVRFIYPTLGVGGNNAVVLEPDGYTRLYDELGGTIPGNVNPFKAYFKDQLYRVWSGSGVTTETQRWYLNLAGFGGPLTFKLVVDVSTNYPDPPTPITDNAKEPVDIVGDIGSGLTEAGGSASISMTLLAWRGQYAVGGVKFEAPDLFDGTENLSYFFEPGPYEYKFVGTVMNTKHAQAGEYKGLVAAWDETSQFYIYDEFPVTVAPGPPSGNLMWAKAAGGSSNDGGSATATLSDKSIVATGRMQGTATFGLGETNQTVLTSAGRLDIFVALYNQDGTLAWVKRAGGSEDDEALGVTVLYDDSIVVTGYFKATAIFGKDEPNQTVLISEGSLDCFIAKYYPNGVLQWAKRAGGTTDESCRAITSLSDYSTIVTGAFTGSATFGKFETNETTLTSSGGIEIFIAKYSSTGSLLWAKRAGGTSNEEGFAITALSDNSTVVTGYYSSHDIIFGKNELNEIEYDTAGNLDIFIARYNPDGTLAWAKRAGGTTGEWGKGIIALSDDSAVVTGYFTGTSIFGLGETNQTILTTAGNSDIFIARYNPDGSLAWVKRTGGSSTDEGIAVTALSDNSTVVTGYFKDSATFGLGEANVTILTTAGGTDIFVARYNTDGTLNWAKRAGGIGGDLSYGIIALPDDSTAVTGNYLGSPVFGPGEAKETILTSAGSYDFFIARYKP
jgi:uncharacterized delta-60 repeat protein